MSPRVSVSPEVGNLCFPTILLPNQAEGQDGVMGSQNKEGVGPEPSPSIEEETGAQGDQGLPKASHMEWDRT